MSDINRVVITGNLGRDPTEKILESGSSYVWFNIAVNNYYKKGDDFVKDTNWVHCKCWGWMKDKALKLSKGDKVAVEGQISVYSRKDKSDLLSVKVNRIIRMGSTEQATEQATEQEPEDKEELPF